MLQRHGSRKHNPCFLVRLLIDLLSLVADPPRWTYVGRCYQQTDPHVRREVNFEIEVQSRLLCLLNFAASLEIIVPYSVINQIATTLFLGRRRQIHVITLDSPCRKELPRARNPL